MTDGTVADVRAMLVSIVGRQVVDGVDDEQLLFDQGLIDSLHIVEIVEYLESTFGVEVTGDDLTPENFGSIAGMARLLNAKRARGGSGRV